MTLIVHPEVEGFQLVHAVYAVEAFLQNLVQRKCNFHVVFFEKHERLCIPEGTLMHNKAKFLLARCIVKQHLLANLPTSHLSIQIHTFQSITDASFKEYLISKGVYFVMCHDGACPEPFRDSTTAGKVSQNTKARIESEESYRKLRCRAMIFFLINHGYNVALINGLDWQDTKVYSVSRPAYLALTIIMQVMTLVVEGSRKTKLQAQVEERETNELESSVGVDNGDRSESRSNDALGDNKAPTDLPTKGAVTYAGKTQRQLLTVAAIARVLEQAPEMRDLVPWFLVHTALLEKLPLANRRQKVVHQDEKVRYAVTKFLHTFSSVSRSILATDAWSEMINSNHTCDLSDLVDGRLFYALAVNKGQELSRLGLLSGFETLANHLSDTSGIEFTAPLTETQPQPASEQNGTSRESNITIMPFSNTVFDKHLAPVKLTVSSKAIVPQTGRIYKEVSHWHNAKRRLDTNKVPLSGRDKMKLARRNDFFMAEMQSYAASLTNAIGKSLEPEIVTVTAGKTSNRVENAREPDTSKESSSKQQGTKSAPKGKGAGKKQAMLESIAASKAAKDSDSADKVFSAWRTVRMSLNSEQNLAKYHKIKAYFRDLPKPKRQVVGSEVQLHLLCTLVAIFEETCKGRDPKKDPQSAKTLGVGALVWDTARRLAATDGLTKPIVEHLKQILDVLKLPDLELRSPSSDRKLACDPGLRLPKTGQFDIGLTKQNFQMLYCGPYMDRNLDSALDPRVPFEPDGWQRTVLDELDAQKSVFVVAPTSAGKTFISFYAMEKILRSNDDSVLIYVAPTKALVNQIAAEIQARFRKSYKHAGKSVWAIHTRDYRINSSTGCQILVTVPHVLQIMLLSPTNAKSWSPRVKYIIFDEIHSIGQAEDGVVWEQLLLLAPCPIIALSATVGNPEQFSSWLAETQQASGQSLTMVKHAHRYSDLRKFLYQPPRHFAFRGLADRPSFATLGLDHIDGLAFVHPIASLVNKSRGIPDDLSLEARDCLSLYHAMAKHETENYTVDPALGPNSRGFSGVLKKADIIKWEGGLKSLLKTWMADPNSPFDSVVDELSKSMDEAGSPDKDVSKGSIESMKADEFAEIDSHDLHQTTLPLLCKLHERDALPAILFNYERHQCERVCRAVVGQLEAAETRWKESSGAWKAKLAGFEQYKKDKLKMSSKKPAKPASKKKSKGDDDEDPGSKMDRMQDAASDDNDIYARFDPQDPVDGYHFAAKHKAEQGELSRYYWQMNRRNLPSCLIDGLKRGIGVHHAGMNRKYRQVVEMLFRKGYLRVIIATGTLALGINMPCATVVFSGDSVFLTALNFRQAAGRAGRRGFDLLGNVVFQNISRGKVCRLLSSRLPDLNGHFPVTTTLVLRLFTLLHESGDSAYAVQAINSLLSQPRLYLDGPAFKDQVLHHLRFSIEYLRRQNLLSSQGIPINFAGLTSHLYFTENSSFALNALIKGEYFHNLCADIKTKESAVLRTLMLVMAHLFGRHPCRQVSRAGPSTLYERVTNRVTRLMLSISKILSSGRLQSSSYLLCLLRPPQSCSSTTRILLRSLPHMSRPLLISTYKPLMRHCH